MMNGSPILPPRKNNYSMSLKKIIKEVAEREGRNFDDFVGPDPKTLFDRANEKDRQRCQQVPVERIFSNPEPEPAESVAEERVERTKEPPAVKARPATVSRSMSTMSIRSRSRSRLPAPHYPRPTTQVSLEEAPRIGLPPPEEDDEGEYPEDDDDPTQAGAGRTSGNRSAPTPQERYTDHGNLTNVLVGPATSQKVPTARSAGNVPAVLSLLPKMSVMQDSEFILLYLHLTQMVERRCEVQGLYDHVMSVVTMAARGRE